MSENRDLTGISRLTVLFGPPILNYQVFLDKIFDNILGKNYKRYLIIDVNDILTPKDIIVLDKKNIVENLIIYKPINIKDVTIFISKIAFSSFYDNIFILLLSLYLHIDNTYFKELVYDPLLVSALIKSIVIKNDSSAVINIDTNSQDIDNLPYIYLIKEYSDQIYYRDIVDSSLYLKRVL